MQRRMPLIVLQEFETFVSEPANFLWGVCNNSRSRAVHDASKRGTFAVVVLLESALSELIKLTGADVRLELAVPCRPVKLQEPFAKTSELFARQRLDLIFKCFEFAHSLPQHNSSCHGRLLPV